MGRRAGQRGMRWDDLRRELLRMPGVPEELEHLYPYHDVSLGIAGLRGTLGMTQTEFAELVDMPQSTIARLESGRHNPSVRVLKRIAEATGTELVIEFRGPKRKRRAKARTGGASSASDTQAREPVAASPTED